jgi:polysaccharide deacetylase family protein (PEP-CTERM system associated)
VGQDRHHITIDVEEYFHVSAFDRHVPRSRWDRMESRLRSGMDRLLMLMDEHEVAGTFFFLGCVAESHPDLVREVAAAGHEVASHGWDHRRVTRIGPEEFRDQARRSREVIESASGTPVTGYRAPSFSITRGCEWALDILVQEGYDYDSSLYPVRRPGYGYRGGKRGIHTLRLPSGELTEVPPATLDLLLLNLPVGGGGSLRHLPMGLTRAALRAAGRNGGPATLYLHPWELDPGQPRIEGISWLTRLRHYGGLERTESRLRRLFREFRFQPIRETLAARCPR